MRAAYTSLRLRSFAARAACLGLLLLPLSISLANSAVAASVVDCGQTPAGSAQSCAPLQVRAVSIYPERISSVSVSSPYFMISADTCTGATLTNTSCSVGVTFLPSEAAAQGPLSALLTVVYTTCPYDAQGQVVCNTASSQSSIAVAGTVAPATPPAAPSSTLTAPSAGLSALPGCSSNPSTQTYCVVVPLD